MRSIVLVGVGSDKTRPAVVLTPPEKRVVLINVTIAPITSTIRGISTEVPVGPAEGLDHDSAISCDNLTTVAATELGREIGLFPTGREGELREAVLAALDFALRP